MDDNKNNKGKYGSYFYTSSNNVNNINSTSSFNNFNDTNTSNVSNTTNKPNRSNPRMISQGRPNPNPVNYAGRGIPKTNRSSYKPLPSPKIDSKNNDENNINKEESNEHYREPGRRSVSDITGKVKKAKDTITFFQKYKIVIIGGCIFFAIVIIFMFMMMVVKLDGDGGRDTSSGSYDEITMNTNGNNNGELWWPIGSSEVTTSIDIDGNTIEFRSGTPVSTWISSGYKTPERPGHAALDITAGGNVYLIAMADGVVTYVKCGTKEKPCTRDTGYNTYGGNSNACTSEGEVSIAIKYNNGYESKYLHLENSSIPEFLKDGSKVYQGQVVGKMGNTGCSDGQHLHLALSVNNETVNPQNFTSANNPRPLSNNIKKRSEDILKNTYDRIEETEPDSGTTVGKDNKQTICYTLKNYGYSDSATAAIMVNMWHESNSFNPNDVNERGCVGVFQWCDDYDRQKNLKRLYPGNEWKKLNNQLEFFQIEMKYSNYKPSRDALENNSMSVSDKTYAFCMNFEVPGESRCIDRRNSKLNNQYYNYVKNGCK